MNALLHAEKIASRLKNSNVDFDTQIFLEATEFAQSTYGNQFRKNGEYTIENVLNVAEQLIYTPADTLTYIVALFTKLPKNCEINLSNQQFEEEIQELLHQYWALADLKINVQGKEFSDAVAKMFFTIAKSPRITLVRLADRLINIQTAEVFDEETKRTIAEKGFQLYCPLSDLLGLGYIHRELQDSAFKLKSPDEYNKTFLFLARSDIENKNVLEMYKSKLDELFKANNIRSELHSRVKGVYSSFLKLSESKEIKPSTLAHYVDEFGLHDTLGLRVLVDTKDECYQTVSILTHNFRTMEILKDYIAKPKKNNYQSIHLYIVVSQDSLMEIQIRTHEMHQSNEYGSASHFTYKMSGNKPEVAKQRYEWVKTILEWQENVQGKPIEEIDYFKNHIYVLTPKHEVQELPKGATVLDFAYQIHHEIGNNALGAYVNDKHVPLDFNLSNGDHVLIITGKRATPPVKFIKSVVTSSAKKELIKAVKQGKIF